LCVVCVLDGLGLRVLDRRWFDRGADALSWSRVREAGACAMKKNRAAFSAFFSSGRVEPTDAQVLRAVGESVRVFFDPGCG
jgi:hypothetical protein